MASKQFNQDILLLDGYIREMQQSVHLIIPTIVITLCFDFYYIANPNSYEWHVQNIEKFKSAKNCQQFKSPFFEIHGFKWCLRIFPNGSTRPKIGNVNCFLWLTSLPPIYSKIAVSITLTLQEADVTVTFPHSFTDGHNTRGWITGTLKTADIQTLNSLTFGVEIIVDDIYNNSGILVNMNDTKKNIINKLIIEQDNKQLLEVRMDSLSSRMDVLTSKMSEMVKTVNDIEMRLNEEKKNNNNDRFDIMMNEIISIKQNMNKVFVNKNSDLIDLERQKLKIWLEGEVKLGEYYNVFIENGIDNLQVATLLTMDIIESMGINKIGHQIKILNDVETLKLTLYAHK